MSKATKNGTLIMRMACAIFFLLFTFLYLYDYQADVLTVAQHVLSQGATHYNRTIGAVIITAVLWLIQIGIYALTGLSRRAHALTYFPSLLLLGILTDVPSDVWSGGFSYLWLWLFPLLIAAYAFLVWVVRQLEPMELPQITTGFFSRMTWINILQMVFMVMITCAIGNSDSIFHYRMRIESDILNGRYAQATIVGSEEQKTDSSLTMLRIWALSKQGELGERLFEYPLKGGSEAMLPNGVSVKLMMVPETWLYKDLGVVFTEKMRPLDYLETLSKTHYATKASHDWLLCAYLLDGRIDDFVNTLPKYYNIKGSLPKSYREALVMYNHQRRTPRIIYRSAVVDADYEDFRSLSLKTKNPQERLSVLRDNFGKTYWFYYYCLHLPVL